METKIKLNRYLIVTAAVWIVSVIALGGGYLLFGASQKSELVQLKTQCAESHSASTGSPLNRMSNFTRFDSRKSKKS